MPKKIGLAQPGMLVWLLLLLQVSCCKCFNIDIRHPLVISNPSSPDSYFGFSVSFLSNQDGPWALATAPRGESTFTPRVDRPGVLFKCHLDRLQCMEVSTGGSDKGLSPLRKEVLDNGWMGVDLTVDSENSNNVIVCGHLQKFYSPGGSLMGNGACCLLTQDLRRVGQLLPFRNHQNISLFNNQQRFGMSSTFLTNAEDIVIGVPGYSNANGAVFKINKKSSSSTYMQNSVISKLQNQDADIFSNHNYLGYSVTSGKFYKLGGVSIAAGAPRDASSKGKIYVVDSYGEFSNKTMVRFTAVGSQMGEYFGAVVLALDLNNDGLTDLLVSSPLFSTSGGGDEGQVSIFISTGVGLTKTKENICGSNTPGARFGTSLAHMGDLNKDGYNDIAVGAPFEGNGAVYIYHGSAIGLKSIPKQRILASDISMPGLSGFGMSISAGRDMDGNGYNDLLIGAHESGHAVYLRTLPVVKVKGRIHFKPTLIDLSLETCVRRDGRKAACFNITYCLRYQGDLVKHAIFLEAVLEADIIKKDNAKRVYFIQEDRPMPSVYSNNSYSRNVERCITHKAYLKPDIEDTISQVKFRVTYKLPSNPYFCKTCPVLDATVPNIIDEEIGFLQRCQDGMECQADLDLTANIVDYSEGEVLIVGQNRTLTINADVKNLGDLAYQTHVLVTIPKDIGVVNYGRCHPKQSYAEEITLFCPIGNPLASGGRATNFKVKLDSSRLSPGVERISINLEARTSSKDADITNNIVKLKARFSPMAIIKITGSSDPEQILLESTPDSGIIPLTYTYKVTKYFPSPINFVYVALSIPTEMAKQNIPFLSINNVQIKNTGGRDTVLGQCNLTQDDILLLSNKRDPDRGDIPDGNYDHNYAEYFKNEDFEENNQNENIGCSNSQCASIICAVGPFEKKRTSATIEMGVDVNVTALENIVGKHKNILLFSHGFAKILDDDFDTHIYSGRNISDDTQVKTMFVSAGTPLSESIESWMIYASIFAGVALLSFIVGLLIKCGFFKRKPPAKEEEVNQIQMEEVSIQ